MATIPEMTEFMAGLPEDARAVLVVQRGRRPFVMRTEELSLGVELEADKWPNWPRAVWEGVSMAISGMPGPQEPGDGGEGYAADA